MIIPIVRIKDDVEKLKNEIELNFHISQYVPLFFAEKIELNMIESKSFIIGCEKYKQSAFNLYNTAWV
tara:strand:+ start:1413 stop:1616 length:204 start_codon:yes stop_codon:yes gene_type:complete